MKRNDFFGDLGKEETMNFPFEFWGFEYPEIVDLDNGYKQINFYEGPESDEKKSAAFLNRKTAAGSYMLNSQPFPFSSRTPFLESGADSKSKSSEQTERGMTANGSTCGATSPSRISSRSGGT